MKPPPFHYVAATSLEEAVDALADAGDEGKVLAGGQSLIPLLNMRLAAPRTLVDINRLDLGTIEVSDGRIRVGATVRHAELEHHDESYASLPLLRQTLGHVAHPVIRNRGTVVGSIAHADPAAELPAVLALLGGEAEARSTGGTRTISADALFVGPLESSVAPDEVVTHVSFPIPDGRTGSAFEELARRHGDYAMAGVAALVILDGDEHVSAARVALTGVGPVPVVVDVASDLGGQSADRLDTGDAVTTVRGAIDPDDDLHATAAYRRHLAGVLTDRALRTAAGRARS